MRVGGGPGPFSRIASLPLLLLDGEACGNEALRPLFRFKDAERGAVSERTFPAWMRRRRLEERFVGRCLRIRPLSERVVVVEGCSMSRGRSGMAAVNRTMSWTISSGRAVPAMLVKLPVHDLPLLPVGHRARLSGRSGGVSRLRCRFVRRSVALRNARTGVADYVPRGSVIDFRDYFLLFYDIRLSGDSIQEGPSNSRNVFALLALGLRNIAMAIIHIVLFEFKPTVHHKDVLEVRTR